MLGQDGDPTVGHDGDIPILPRLQVLLLLDGLSTHVKNLQLIEEARENGVIIFSFPPHCTHRLQPLDVAFMKPLATYYVTKVANWLRNHSGLRSC